MGIPPMMIPFAKLASDALSKRSDEQLEEDIRGIREILDKFIDAIEKGKANVSKTASDPSIDASQWTGFYSGSNGKREKRIREDTDSLAEEPVNNRP